MNHSLGGWWWRLKLSPDKTAECSKALAPDPDLWLQKQFCVLSSLRMQTLRDISRGDNNSFLYLLTKIKRRLLLGRKLMTNLDSILKSRDITLPTKVRLVKAMVFPVVMYGCESWTIKKAECWRIGALELWCWRRLLRVPWTARRSNQSILKISPGCSLEGLMLKLTPILWPPHAKSWLIGKDPDAERDWGQEEKGTTEDEMVGWCHRHNGHGFGWTPGVGDGQGGLACCIP